MDRLDLDLLVNLGVVYTRWTLGTLCVARGIDHRKLPNLLGWYVCRQSIYWNLDLVDLTQFDNLEWRTEKMEAVIAQ